MAPRVSDRATSFDDSSSVGKNNNKKNGDIAPVISSGFVRMRGTIVASVIFLTSVYTGLYFLYLDSSSIMGWLPPPADEFCTENNNNDNDSNQQVCSRSDLFAFQVASGLAIAFCGVVGFHTWHIRKRAETALPANPEGRLFGYLPESELLGAVNFSFQFWDFFISLLIPEHRGPLMLMHHCLAAIISWCSLEFQMLHYYGVYFLGVTEFSSIFLVFVDLAKFFPPQAGTLYDTIVGGLFGPMFALTFTIYRIVLWCQVSLLLWKDCWTVFSSGMAEKLRPGKSVVLYVFLGLNLPLTLLQFYWFSIILGEVKKVLTGDDA